MALDQLNIVEVEGVPGTLQNRRKEELLQKFEKMWHSDPEQFNPMRNAMERERIQRTWDLLLEFVEPADKLVADLGCGYGVLSQRLCERGACVDAVDIADAALKRLKKKEIPRLSLKQNCVPRTTLDDDTYDLVMSTDLIAFLFPDDFRLFFSELSRLVKKNGYVLCSTPLDITSEDALQRFATLAETEFKIEKWIFSYHNLSIRLLDFLLAPSRFVQAKNDTEYRQKEIDKRRGMGRWWFRLNSTIVPALFWSIVQYPVRPLIKLGRQNKFILDSLEKISRFIWSDSGISHAIFIGTRRPLVEIPPENRLPRERKHKKEVWE